MIAAISLRLIHLDWGLPGDEVFHLSFNEDEWRMVNSVMEVDLAQARLLPGQVIYASAPIYLYAGILTALNRLDLVPFHHDIGLYRADPAAYRRMVAAGRFMIVCFSLAAVMLVYLLGRRLYSASIGLAAAAMFAIAPGHVIEAHFIKSNAIMVFWSALMAIQVIALYERPTPGRHILAGLALGAAAATQYNGIVFLIPLVMARWMRAKGHGFRRLPLDAALPGLLLSCGVAFILLSPATLIAVPNQGSSLADIFKAFGRDRFYTYPQGGLFHEFGHVFPHALAPPVAWFGGLGCIMLLRRARDRLLLAMLLITAVLPLCTNLKTSRYVLFTAPFFCLAAARLLAAGHAARSIRLVRGVLLAVSLAWEGSMTIAHLELMGMRDPRLQADDWLRRNLPVTTPVITLREFRGLYPPSLDPLAARRPVIRDGLHRPELLGACRFPVVVAGLEMDGVHGKYLRDPVRYAAERLEFNPLLDGGCYRLAASFRNQPTWWRDSLTGRWLPVDLTLINPEIRIFMPARPVDDSKARPPHAD
ncbi:glycosyltransferase family 39 protein [bacterium]|nr:glycosyltransferase family 39 protein [candidate division CSSED10-310 bacterium]